MQKQILYATTNPGKLYEVGLYLANLGIQIVNPKNLGIDIDVEETGKTLEENAVLKVKAYSKQAPDMIIIGDDTGVEIDALGGAPGIHVRRWKDKKTRLTDQQVIDHCILLMKDVPKNKRTAQFRTSIALKVPGKKIKIFNGVLKGEIVQKPKPLKIEGFPFETLFYIPKWKMLLQQVHEITSKPKNKYLTHRELAIRKAVKNIKWK